MEETREIIVGSIDRAYERDRYTLDYILASTRELEEASCPFLMIMSHGWLDLRQNHLQRQETEGFATAAKQRHSQMRAEEDMEQRRSQREVMLRVKSTICQSINLFHT